MNTAVRALAIVLLGLAWPGPIAAQSQAPAPTAGAQDGGWKVSAYPIYIWVPFGIGIDVTLPPADGGTGESGGSIVDKRFDGAFLGGVSAAKGPWRIDFDGLWAAVGGDRTERPVLRVDSDIIYAHLSGGRRIFSDVYVTAGVRRLVLKYDIALGDRSFSREPGIWDPLVGTGWHHEAGEKLELHASFEGGGFGVGAETDISTSARVDWKPTTHFGLTAGYALLYFKVEDTLVGETFTVEETLHGPIVGIGLYF